MFNSIIHWIKLFPADYQYSTTACVIKAILEVLPPYFRFAQCMRRYRDSKGIFLHIVNGGKFDNFFLDDMNISSECAICLI